MSIFNPRRNNTTVLSFLNGLPGKAWRRLRGYYRRWFCQQNYIFRHQGPFSPETRTDCEFASYSSFDDIPGYVKESITSDGGQPRLETDKMELGENAVLWVASIGEQIAATVFTRQGIYFRRWFFPLQPEDLVVFRLRTHPDFRGRGLAPALIRHAMQLLLHGGEGNAYIDCRTYNKPSIRCIGKAGFHRVATKKTITREWALHE